MAPITTETKLDRRLTYLMMKLDKITRIDTEHSLTVSTQTEPCSFVQAEVVGCTHAKKRGKH